jgi:two-component system response regulator YesN
MYASSAGMNLNEVSGVNIIEFIEKTRNIDQFFLWIEAIVQKLQECTIASRSNNAQKILEKAVSYVCEFYTEPDLTMEGVCNNLGISESYLSQLFKKYKETTFVKFLTGLRMEKAIELLVNTGDRIVEIANSCGYQDVYYFSHSFKKYTGSAPKKYREDHTS